MTPSTTRTVVGTGPEQRDQDHRHGRHRGNGDDEQWGYRVALISGTSSATS